MSMLLRMLPGRLSLPSAPKAPVPFSVLTGMSDSAFQARQLPGPCLELISLGLHIWGLTWEGQRSVVRKEDEVVNYSCVPGVEPQYNWVAPRYQQLDIC